MSQICPTWYQSGLIVGRICHLSQVRGVLSCSLNCDQGRRYVRVSLSLSRDGRFGSKVGQIGPKWDKSGAFSDLISVHLAPRAKCTEIWSEKAPDLTNLGSNLTHFRTKPTIPDSQTHIDEYRGISLHDVTSGQFGIWYCDLLSSLKFCKWTDLLHLDCLFYEKVLIKEINNSRWTT